MEKRQAEIAGRIAGRIAGLKIQLEIQLGLEIPKSLNRDPILRIDFSNA